jgi:pimeloyl-ACP methyl ester carboxylesterase
MTPTAEIRARSTRMLHLGAIGLLIGVAGLTAAHAEARVLDPRQPQPLLHEHSLAQAPVEHRTTVAARSAAPERGVTLEPCDDATPDGLCGTVTVPLDRKHPSLGTVPIFFELYPHRAPGPADEAVLITQGGPGSSVTQDPFIGSFYRGVFDPLLDTRDLILLDQRGVGRSDAIDCPELQDGSDRIYADVKSCGDQLGRAASRYGTGDVAHDIEAVRRALGIEKLNLYGASYAAQDIQSYATRFPGHLRSAVLDSPFTVLGYDTFAASSVAAINRAIRLICARSQSCSAERADALDQVAWLARRLRHEPLEGIGNDTFGEPHEVRVTEGFLLWRLLNAEDGGFAALSEIAAAADALRGGDEAPLLRLAAEHDRPLFGDEGDPTVFSAGHNWGRFCTDAPFPWDKRASTPTRLHQWLGARASLRPDSFAPFSVQGWLAPFPVGPIAPEACITWPAPEGKVTPAFPRRARFPGEVPALVLSGDIDSFTPTADARRLANAWPNSQLVELANSGHHTALRERFDCADAMIVNFIAELEPGDTSCAADESFGTIPALGRFLQTAADARPARSGEGDQSTRTDRKVASAAAAAITDAMRRTFMSGGPGPGVGLRGGTFEQGLNGDETALVNTLNAVRFARDVAVSGESSYLFEIESIDATVTVDGPGTTDGALHVTGAFLGFTHQASALEIEGQLGGRRVVVTVPAT